MFSPSTLMLLSLYDGNIFKWDETLQLQEGCNFLPMLAIMAIEQWVFLSVSHVLWHGASIYNCHIRGLVTLTPFAERLAVELSLPDLTTYVYRGLDSNTQPSACGANAVTHYATAVTLKLIKCKHATIHRTFFKMLNTFFIYNQDCWVDYS